MSAGWRGGQMDLLLEEVRGLDTRTVEEIERRFERMAQPNSLSVVIMAGEMINQGGWDQATLNYISAEASREHEKGPGQRIMGWSDWLRHLATNIRIAQTDPAV